MKRQFLLMMSAVLLLLSSCSKKSEVVANEFTYDGNTYPISAAAYSAIEYGTLKYTTFYLSTTKDNNGNANTVSFDIDLSGKDNVPTGTFVVNISGNSYDKNKNFRDYSLDLYSPKSIGFDSYSDPLEDGSVSISKSSDGQYVMRFTLYLPSGKAVAGSYSGILTKK